MSKRRAGSPDHTGLGVLIGVLAIYWQGLSLRCARSDFNRTCLSGKVVPRFSTPSIEFHAGFNEAEMLSFAWTYKSQSNTKPLFHRVLPLLPPETKTQTQRETERERERERDREREREGERERERERRRERERERDGEREREREGARKR